MKKSFIIQIILLVGAVIWTNIGAKNKEVMNDGFNANAGGIKVDLTGDIKIFDSSPTDKAVKKGGTLVVAWSAEPENLNYYTSTSANAKRFLDYIYETLISYDYADWSYSRPILAKKFEVSDDGKTYRFYLRDNITWHDGEPMTIDDVVFSMKALMNPFVDDAPLRAYYDKVIDAHAEGDSVFVISTSEYYFMNLEFLGGFAIMPKHIWDPKGYMDEFTIADLNDPRVTRERSEIRQFADDFNAHSQGRPVGFDAEPIIGSGPWRFDKWITGEYMSMVRNDSYWNKDEIYIPLMAEDGTNLDKIIIKTIQDPTAMLTALKSGEVDFLPRMRAIQYFEQTNTDDFLDQFQKVTYNVPAYSYIGWNNDKPYFQDKRVRQAMTMLVDRDSYNKYIGYDLGVPTIGPFYIFGKQYNHNVPRWPYDPIRAVELIEEAGWIDHDGDGIRDKDGVPFSFIFSVSAGSRGAKYLSLMMKEDLRKIGINVDIRQLEWSVYVENLRDRQFDVVMLLWIGGLETDPYQIWHSDNIGSRGSNYIGFRNDEADSLIKNARYEIDEVKRNAMYYRLQEIFHDEQPYTFMFYQRDPGAYTKRFNGVKWIPIRPGYNFASWWDNQSVSAMAPSN